MPTVARSPSLAGRRLDGVVVKVLIWLDRAGAVALLGFGVWVACDLVERAAERGWGLLVPAVMVAVSTVVLALMFVRNPNLGAPLSWLRLRRRRALPPGGGRRTVGRHRAGH